MEETGFIKSWQPLMDRIEIKGEIEKESLAKILYHSRAKCNYLILNIRAPRIIRDNPFILVRKSIHNIDNSIKNEQRMMQGFQLESNRRKAEMDHQINVSHTV